MASAPDYSYAWGAMENATNSKLRDRKPARHVLLWLFVFAYVPFAFVHGYETWSQPAYDFPPLYFATKLVFEHGQSPYREDAFAREAVALGRWVPPFIYPPPSLLALWPLHFFDYDGAKAALLITNHLCILFAVWFVFRRLFREALDRAGSELVAAVALIYILFFDPTVVTLHLGQVNLLLLLCICFAWEALKRNRHALAVAVPLSIAIVLKTYPVLLLPLLVFRRRYVAAAATVALFGVYFAASYFLLPQNVWSEWITKVIPAGAEAHAGPWNQNIRAFVARALQPNPFSDPLFHMPSLVRPVIITACAVVAGATFLTSLLSWRRPHSPQLIDLQLSLYLFMIFLIAPVSWEHHFVYLLPSLVLVLLLLFSRAVAGHWRWILALSLCLIAWRVPITMPELTHGWGTLLISAKFYPALAIWIFLLRACYQQMRQSEPDLSAGDSAAVSDFAPAQN